MQALCTSIVASDRRQLGGSQACGLLQTRSDRDCEQYSVVAVMAAAAAPLVAAAVVVAVRVMAAAAAALVEPAAAVSVMAVAAAFRYARHLHRLHSPDQSLAPY